MYSAQQNTVPILYGAPKGDALGPHIYDVVIEKREAKENGQEYTARLILYHGIIRTEWTMMLQNPNRCPSAVDALADLLDAVHKRAGAVRSMSYLPR